MKFGCHLSIKNGFLGAAIKAKQLDVDAFQYFPKNPRSLRLKDVNKSDAENCRQFCEKNRIVSIAHSPYPTNLTPANDKREYVVRSLLNDLEIANKCGSIGVVVHFGKDYNPIDPLPSYQLMIEILNEVTSHSKGECKLLLENNAGKSGTMGTTLEELVRIKMLVDYPEKIGFCLATCHAFVSGLWNGDNWEEVVEAGEKLNYFEYLDAVHLNNSKYPSGSGKDRHANIFHNGYINKDQWSDFLSSEFLKNIPLILETPKEFGITHEQEIRKLKQQWK